MPRRSSPDPVAAKIGHRVRAFREAQGYTLEKLAFEGGLSSKGHLSDLENGRLIPTVRTLHALATHLGIELMDLLTFPDTSVRHRLVAKSATLPVSVLQRWCEESASLPVLVTSTKAKASKRAPVVVLHTVHPPQDAIPLVELVNAARALCDDVPMTSGRWIKADARTRGVPGAFAAVVHGTAMMPRVDDGAICLFRRPGPGNRSGRIFLVWHRRLGPHMGPGADLLKLVQKDTIFDGAVLLRALNPAVAPVRVNAVADELRVIAEFVTVLEVPKSAGANDETS